MNEERSDLAALRRDLDRVENDIQILRDRADAIETRIALTAFQKAPPPIVLPVEQSAPTPPPLPPLAPALPPVIPEESLEKYFQTIPEPVPQIQEEVPIAATVSVPPPHPPTPAPVPASLELRLGTYWFVRIGIVMFLTALVFLGNYAYQHYIPRFGPLGKLVLLYLASFGLLAAGSILPRRQERLKNYGQVLFAGGLAAVYFTTYAAHHFENLLVIKSAILDGALLLAWTSFIVWLADRKQSETLAIFAIGLAYYAALITNVGNFTILSNLLLAAAAVFFLIRNRWTRLTLLSLVASYGSYFYWRYYAGSAGSDLDSSRFVILGYWLIFTAGVFLSRHEKFSGQTRAEFLTFNNGAAFALLTASYYAAHTGDFWKLATLSGAILLGLSALALRTLKDDQLARRAYLAQGLLLVTLGLIAKLRGPTLPIILAIESVFLLICATQWRSALVKIASILAALLSSAFFAYALADSTAEFWLKSGAFTVLLLFNATWAARKLAPIENPLASAPLPGYFTLLALGSWTAAVFKFGEAAQIGPILALTGAALTLTHPLLRVREITLVSQALVAIAQVQSLFLVLDGTPSPWSPLTVIGVSLLLALWWKRQQSIQIDSQLNILLQIFSALAAALIMYAWLPKEFPGDIWFTIAAGLTIGWTLLGASTRSWPIVAAGQMFLLGTSAFLFTRLIGEGAPEFSLTLLPILTLIALAAIAFKLKSRTNLAAPMSALTHIYHWLATILTLAVVMSYVLPEFRFITLAALFVVSLAAAISGARYAFIPGVFLAGCGLFYWLLEWRNTGSQPQHLIAILALASTQALLRKRESLLPVNPGAHQTWIVIMAASLWLYISAWTIAHSGGEHFYLTVSWAVASFLCFIAGFALRERAYRWSALAILTAAVGRVVILDVWRLETLYRILSFMALALVLLALGYIYTRFQEKIAKWL